VQTYDGTTLPRKIVNFKFFVCSPELCLWSRRASRVSSRFPP